MSDAAFSMASVPFCFSFLLFLRSLISFPLSLPFNAIIRWFCVEWQ
ncbi:hypothetical protein [Bifidobacterium callitrichos]|nr:hypothetical protein [Bifidobacterium callitrichos]